MRTTLLPAVVLSLALVACGERAAVRPTLPAVAWDDGAPRALPPARPDSKAIVYTRVRIFTASTDQLAAAGLPTGGGAVVLQPEVTEDTLQAATAEDLLLPNLTSMSGQRASAYEMKQSSCLADYRLINGLAKPEIEVVNVGTAFESLVRVVDGKLLIDEAEVTSVAMPSVAKCSAEIPGYGRIAWEEPYLVTARTVALPPGFVIRPGARLALPMRYRATRACAQVRTLLPAGTVVDDAAATGGLEHGVSVAVLTFDWTYAPEPERVLFDDAAPGVSVRLQRQVDAAISGRLDAVVAELGRLSGLSIAVDAALPEAERAAPVWVGEGETVLAALTRLAADGDLYVEVGHDGVTLSLPAHEFPAPPLGLLAGRTASADERQLWKLGESPLPMAR